MKSIDGSPCERGVAQVGGGQAAGVETALAGGRYELGPVVGTGGMAQVRRATDTVLGREVAVKVFRDDLDEDSAARARLEMQTLAGLTHPNLVAVHDAGTSGDSQPFLVMELIDGPTLAACCVDGSLTSDQVIEIGRGLADALAYVHGRGVVHRDVKPANVLIAPSGAKLTDFGIARIVDGARHTGTGLTIGTAPYLSPEQVTGEPVGPPADVYALGLVLLECLTGHREYSGGPVETAMARLHRQPEIPVDLPGPWPTLLRAMTARHAEHRPSAADVAHALQGGTLGMADPAAPATQVISPAAAETAHPSTRVYGPVTRVARVRVAEPAPASPRPRAGWRHRARTAWILGAVATLVLLVIMGSSPMDLKRLAPVPAKAPAATTPVEQHIADLTRAVTP